MAKCKNCKNLYDFVNENNEVEGTWCEEIMDSPDEELERGCAQHVPMTNADRIRRMSDEELAKHFSDLIKDTNEHEYCEDVSDWLKWLKGESVVQV